LKRVFFNLFLKNILNYNLKEPEQPRELPVAPNGFAKPAYSYSCLIGLALKNSTTGEVFEFLKLFYKLACVKNLNFLSKLFGRFLVQRAKRRRFTSNRKFVFYFHLKYKYSPIICLIL